MARSILDTVGLAVTVAFAVPLVLVGVTFLGRGDTLSGAALLALAVLMVLAEEFLVSPEDLLRRAAGDAVEGVVGDDGTADDGTTDGGTTDDPGTRDDEPRD